MKLWDIVYILLLNDEILLIICILNFMSRIKFMLRWVEHDYFILPRGQ